MAPPLTVAVLGMGIMGSAMARQLLAAGHEVRVWNRTAERARPLEEAGASVAATPAEAAREADVVVTMLSDGPAVESTATGAEGALSAMRDGTLWLQMSTVGPTYADRLGALAEAGSIDYVDAPVLGTKGPAEKGELLILASGPDALKTRAEPIFEVVGKRTLWAGEAGAGSRLKLVVNNWLLGLVGTLAESIALAEAIGVDPEQFLGAIAGGPVDSPYAQIKGKSMIAGELEANFPLRLALKDLRLVLEAATSAGLSPAVAPGAADLFERAVDDGLGDADMSAVCRTASQKGER